MKRIYRIASILIYITSFIVTTEALTVPLFGYMGFTNRNEPLILIYLFCILPFLFIPKTDPTPASYITYLFYMLIYVPTIVVIYHLSSSLALSADPTPMSLAMLSCMLIVISQQYIPKPFSPRLNISIHIKTLRNISIALGLLFLIIVTAKLYKYFSITGLFDVYEKRQAIMDLQIGFMRYIQSWLTNVILPVLFTIFITSKHKKLAAISIIIYIYLFFLGGHKTYLFAPAFLALALYSYNNKSSYQTKINFIFSAAISFPLLGLLAYEDFFKLWTGMVNVRTFSIQGLAAGVYHDFFTDHPFTYMSQLKFFSLLNEYPYTADIPIVLNNAYGLGNFNSHTFFSDGYSSFGYLGMLASALGLAVYLYLFDSLTQKNVKFFLVATAFYTSTILNVSLATSLLTFGGLIFILIALIRIREE